MRRSALNRAMCAVVLLSASLGVSADPVWTDLGLYTNDTSPNSVWLEFSVGVAPLISGASSATLTFDLRNDSPNPYYTASSTISRAWFGTDGDTYFARFAYEGGGNSSHWRDVRLIIDGWEYVDQYGAYNDHLGDDHLGTAYQGSYPAASVYPTSYAPGIYVLDRSTPVPEPLGPALILAAAVAAMASRRDDSRRHRSD